VLVQDHTKGTTDPNLWKAPAAEEWNVVGNMSKCPPVKEKKCNLKFCPDQRRTEKIDR
jgi:hypothetical protein